MTNTLPPDQRTDTAGFPLESCGRCGGSGTYPSSAWNGVCLDCNGDGWMYPVGKVAKLAAEWSTIRAAATTVVLTARRDYAVDGTSTLTTDVQAGDQVRVATNTEWRTIAAVTVTDEVRGTVRVGVGDTQRLLCETLATTVEFTNGDVITVDTAVQWKRRLTPEVQARLDALVPQATKAYATLLKGRITRAAKAEQKRAAKIADDEANVQQLLETYPDLGALLGDEYADNTGFMGSMRDALNRGSMSDKMIASALEAIRRDRQQKEDKANAIAAGVTVPTGRRDVEGVVIATWAKWNDRGWGSWLHKMRIKTADGWTAAGTIPGALLELRPASLNLMDPDDPEDASRWLRGRKIRIRATFAPGDRDPLSGWFSRPTAEVVDEAVESRS
jgi:hypothetical protein